MEGLDVTLSATEAQELLSERLGKLRSDKAVIERETQAASSEREKAWREVSELRKERDTLIEEIAKAHQDKARITESLKEHRTNVERSLTEQETKAKHILDQAADIEAKQKAQTASLLQRAAQLKGVKQTIESAIAQAEASFAASVEKARALLKPIPD